MNYSVTACSLNKRPIGEMMEESNKKKGVKKPKKAEPKVINTASRIDTGIKKSLAAKGATDIVRVSHGVTAKKKDELFGRVSSD